MKRKQFDILLIVVLAVGGLVGYPWARVRWQLTLLRSPNAEQALAAQDTLTALGPKAIPQLIRFVRAPTDGTPRRMGIEVLLRREFGVAQNTDDPDVVNLALDLAADDWDQEAQSRAIQWLSLGKVSAATPVFRSLLHYPDGIAREDAIRALRATRGSAATADIAPLLFDPDPGVQQHAAIALGQLTGDAIIFPRDDTPEAGAERKRIFTAWLAAHDLEREPGDAPDMAPRKPPPAPDAPAFALPDLAGGTVRLADFRGTPVLINFWATWCPPCEQELPALAAVAQEFGDRAVIVGVTQEFESTAMAERALEAEGTLDREGDAHGHQHGTEHLDAHTLELVLTKQHEMIEAKVAEKGLGYAIVIGNEEVGAAYGVTALPVSVLVGPDGRILRRLVGPRHAATFRALLEAAGA